MYWLLKIYLQKAPINLICLLFLYQLESIPINFIGFLFLHQQQARQSSNVVWKRIESYTEKIWWVLVEKWPRRIAIIPWLHRWFMLIPWNCPKTPNWNSKKALKVAVSLSFVSASTSNIFLAGSHFSRETKHQTSPSQFHHDDAVIKQPLNATSSITKTKPPNNPPLRHLHLYTKL
jgi:hypothetical protein